MISSAASAILAQPPPAERVEDAAEAPAVEIPA